jgi:hypothetical protein
MEGQQHTASGQQAVTPDDLVKGTIIRVPGRYHPAHPGRPYCLEIIKLVSVSKETGAVELTGKVLALNGTTTRKRPVIRTVVVMPDRITIASKPDTEG